MVPITLEGKASELAIGELDEVNFDRWIIKMEGRLGRKTLFRVVNGELRKPAASDSVALAVWEEKNKKACGEILGALSDSQLVHVVDIRRDAAAMWKKLHEVHQQKRPATRFNAYLDFLHIVHEPGETYQSFINRVHTCRLRLFNLLPAETTVLQILDELEAMTALHGLPDEAGIMKATLQYSDSLDLGRIKQAFVTADTENSRGQQAMLVRSRSETKVVEAEKEKWCEYHENSSHDTKSCFTLQSLKKGKKPARQENKGIRGKREDAGSSRLSDKSQKEKARLASVSSGEESTADETVSAFAVTHTDRKAQTWVVDSGATSTMTADRHALDNYRPYNCRIQVADGKVIEAVGIGEATLPSMDGDYRVKRVLHVPDITCNLFSLPAFTAQAGCTALFNDNTCTLSHNQRVIMQATRKSSLYQLETAYLAAKRWHQRLGHADNSKIKKLHTQDLVRGMDYTSDSEQGHCEPCIMGKQHRLPFPKKASRATEQLELVHTDVHDNACETKSGYRYWVSFIDDYSRYAWLYPLKRKSEVFGKFVEWQVRVERETGKQVRTVRDDKGGEYSSLEARNYYASLGLQRQTTTRATPQQNGVAERLNRTVEERIIAMLHQADLPKYFWLEAMDAYMALHNALPTSAVPDSTPYIRYHGKKPDISGARTFGCLAYAHVQKDQRKHLESHARKCMFIGYVEGVKGWKVYDYVKRRTLVTGDVLFNEDIVGLKAIKASESESSNSIPPSGVEDYRHTREQSQIQDLDHEDEEEEEDLPLIVPGGAAENAPDNPPPPRHGRSMIPRPYSGAGRLNQPLAQAAGRQLRSGRALLIIEDVPRTYKEALQMSDADLWREAAFSEMEAHLRNGTWQVVTCPPDRKAIGSRWVFARKYRADGSIERYKARIVGKGFSQIPGLDFTELFAPVAKWESMRTILDLAAKEDWEIHQIDFDTAFLNGDLEEDLYMVQPQGFEIGGKEQVCKLLKAIPGLRQASRAWYKKLDQALHNIDFARCSSDPNIYTMLQQGSRQILSVYVDDEIMTADSPATLAWTKEQLAKYFKFKDQGEAKYILGVEIRRDRSARRLWLSQRKYCQDILAQYGMQDCQPVSTPMAREDLTTDMCPSTLEDKAVMRDVPYLSAIGSLLYLATCTRPDLSYTVGVLARFNANPGMAHWKAVKRVFRYLRGTTDLSSSLGHSTGVQNFRLLGYSDADYAHDTDTRKSTSAYAYFIGKSLVAWKSKRQPVIALSTTEAEYISACYAGQEGVWLRGLLDELGYPQDEPTLLLMDNQSAIKVAKNPEHHGRMKHMDVRYKWLRAKVADSTFTVDYVQTGEMAADILTKPLAKLLHRRGVEMLGLTTMPQ